ncbi:peptidase M24 [Deltaproteobacteria bacterium]|nr:peptidase M24 [Deltaproteobacteria bacterium]
MNKERFAERREKLRKKLHEKALAAHLVTLDANRFYLSGFELMDHQVNESAGCLLVLKNGHDWLCTDARYYDAAKRLWDERYIHIYGADAAASINQLARREVSGIVGFEESAMSVRFHKIFAENLILQSNDGLVEELRVIKEPEEIACMETSLALNHKLMAYLPSRLTPGRSEAEISWDVELFFRQNGAEGLAFPSICAIGENAALPHAVPGESRIRENVCVLIDVGCRFHNYCSDQTRTFWVGGKESKEFSAAMRLVREAQEKAIAAIRPGLSVSDIYAVAKSFFDERSVGSFFTHGLGHGVGLQTHEAPSLNSRSGAILRPGMVVTVEPGLYYPEWGGIRWEDMVLITEDGCRIL